MGDEYKLKMAVIAGASEALKFRNKQRMADDNEVIQHVSDMTNQIIAKIEDEEED